VALHGIAGGVNVNLPSSGSATGCNDGEASETVIFQRIKSGRAPVLRPDGPMPAHPIL
jgi:hypothetical protein